MVWLSLKENRVWMFEIQILLCLLQADQICYAVLCVFSYVAAGMEQQQLLEASRIKGRIYRTL